MKWFSGSKWMYFLILLLLLAVNTKAMKKPRLYHYHPLVVVENHHHDSHYQELRAKQTKKIPPSAMVACQQLRGGDLGPVSGKTLATTLSVLAGCDAICGAIIPRTSMGWFGISVPPDSLSHKYLHGIGASAATVAISLYFATTTTSTSTTSTIQQALAYGFLARLISMTIMIVSDEEQKVGMNFGMFGTMWISIAITIYCLLQGIGDPLALTKVISVVLGVHGLFLHTYPGVVLRTRTRIAVGPDPLAKEILSIDGGYMIASAITTFLLARGMDPVRVAGWTAISFIPVLLKVCEVVSEGQQQMLGYTTGGFFAVAVTFLMASIIVGTLH